MGINESICTAGMLGILIYPAESLDNCSNGAAFAVLFRAPLRWARSTAAVNPRIPSSVEVSAGETFRGSYLTQGGMLT